MTMILRRQVERSRVWLRGNGQPHYPRCRPSGREAGSRVHPGMLVMGDPLRTYLEKFACYLHPQDIGTILVRDDSSYECWHVPMRKE